MAKITKNMVEVLGVLKDFENGAFAREVLAKVEGKTFNGVNATLAAAAGKGYCTKVKAVYGEGEGAKMLTKYTITEAGVEVIETPEEDAPVEDAE
jgi:uncharacterized protein YhfF